MTKLRKQFEKRGYTLYTISAYARTDVKPLLWKVAELLQTAPELEAPESMPVYRPAEDPNAFTIERTSDGWRVRSKALERAAAMTYWEFDAPVRRFQRMIDTLGVEKALREAGIQEGDMVFIGDNELEWQD